MTSSSAAIVLVSTTSSSTITVFVVGMSRSVALSVTAGADVGVAASVEEPAVDGASVGESVAFDSASVGESSRTGLGVVVSVAETAVVWR